MKKKRFCIVTIVCYIIALLCIIAGAFNMYATFALTKFNLFMIILGVALILFKKEIIWLFSKLSGNTKA